MLNSKKSTFLTSQTSNNTKSYQQKYLKYKEKYLSLKNKLNNQTGGEISLTIQGILKHVKFPSGTYKVHIKMLEGGKDSPNDYKICHHYSVFSLYDFDDSVCCNIDTKILRDVLRPECNSDTCDVTDKLPCTEKCVPKEFKVRFYNFSDPRTLACGRINNTFYPHSGRIDGGLCWHKFNGHSFIIAVETADEKLQNLNYCVAKELTITSYDVPTSMFKDGVEKDEIYDVTV